MSVDQLMFSFGRADPSQINKLGAKGAKLVEDFQHIQSLPVRTAAPVAVPDGFILTTALWRRYHALGDRLTDELFEQILEELKALEERTGKKFGDTSGRRPLIVAVRGGAPVSLPGALGTLLNVGLNFDVVSALMAAGEDRRFVLTTFLTAIRMYGEGVLDIQYEHFFKCLQRHQAGDEGTLSEPLLRQLIDDFQDVLESHPHPRYPARFEPDLGRQLRNAVESVLSSWMSPTAREARRSRNAQDGGIPENMGTAVIIQEMAFGNSDEESLSGVFFTRNQRTGANHPVIEWAPKVQCDKIVSGKLRKQLRRSEDLQERFPAVFQTLMELKDVLETRAKRPLDIEFSVEGGKVHLLQRRPLRMTSAATVRAMWDFVDEGKTNIQLASMVINNALEQREKVLRSDLQEMTLLGRGEPITDTADTGILVFGTDEALQKAQAGMEVVLLRKRPYGENDVAVNHPNVRAIIRYDGNATGHEAVSALAYSKPYVINMVDAAGHPLVVVQGDDMVLNPRSLVTPYLGKRVFVDGERGILGVSPEANLLEDRKGRKKLYVDWEYLREHFNASGYDRWDYEALLDLHHQWELELEHYQTLEKNLRDGAREVEEEAMLQAMETYLHYIPARDRERILRLKDVSVEDFRFGPPLTYHGNQLGREFLLIAKTLMLCTTWRTHWVHELMVDIARSRGETENDVIRDIFLKNSTMSLVKEFEEEGFHVMKVPHFYHLVLASNFEYTEDLDKVQIGPDILNYKEKEILAQQFLSFLQQTNSRLHQRVRIIKGEPPLGQGHARIISIGLYIPHEDFALVCRYLRTFLNQCLHGCTLDLLSRIPESAFIPLYQLDPYFAPHPQMEVRREAHQQEDNQECSLIFGRCSFGEFDGTLFGKDDYEMLNSHVANFATFIKERGSSLQVRPWQFEVDPYRRHSVIGAVGIRFDGKHLCEVLDALKHYIEV